jgi:hydroxymethylglutaryl-CoA reductase
MKTYDKVPTIVTNKIVKEKIKFQGKTIIRERVIKEWNIPKVITSDIGFQLMFGMSPPSVKSNQNCGIDTVNINLPND